MSRTAEPHPASYFAFACLVTELLYAWDVALPISLPPASLDCMRDLVPGPVLNHHARWHAYFRSFLEASIREKLIALGLPPPCADNPACQQHIASEADRELFIFGEQLARRTFFDINLDEEGMYKPRRSTVRQIIAGEHFAFGEGNRAQTAKSLNVSISRIDEAWKVSDANVRDGLLGFVTQITRTTSSYIEAVAAEVRRARILNLLWERFVASERTLRLPGLIARIESDDFLNAHDDLLVQTPLIEVLPSNIHREAVAVGRGPIFAQARKNMALYLARGGDRAAIPEHLQFLVSQSA